MERLIVCPERDRGGLQHLHPVPEESPEAALLPERSGRFVFLYKFLRSNLYILYRRKSAADFSEISEPVLLPQERRDCHGEFVPFI